MATNRPLAQALKESLTTPDSELIFLAFKTRELETRPSESFQKSSIKEHALNHLILIMVEGVFLD